jgi:hypothetical protein
VSKQSAFHASVSCHCDRFYDGEVRCPIKGDARGRTRDFVEGNSTDLNLAGCYGFLQVLLRARLRTVSALQNCFGW